MFQHLPGRLAAVAFLAALAGGCGLKDTASIQAAAICSMPDDCTFSSTCDAQYIGTPQLDLGFANNMWLAIEFHNNMPNNADPEAGRVNTHDAYFESYDLEYTGLRAAIDPAEITGLAPVSGWAQQRIPAEGTAVIGVEPFPVHVVNAILSSGGTVPTGPDYDEVRVKVTFKGRLEDGSDWEVPLEIPVRLCTDCVFPICDDPTQVPVSACPSLYQYPRGKINCVAP